MSKINQAFILAAGRGKRMQHLTDDKPKPLVEVCGKSLIDYNIDHIRNYGIKDCIVNLCYKGDMIRTHLSSYSDINFVFSEEEDALETGGGIQNALNKIRNEAFFVINSDALWLESEGSESLLTDMANLWDDSRYDMLMMLQPIDNSYGVGENGDYFLNAEHLPQRRIDASQKAPYLYGGVLICHPRIFDNELSGRYSLVRVFDRLQREGRLGAYIHKGKWFHVGDPQAKQTAEMLISQAMRSDNL